MLSEFLLTDPNLRGATFCWRRGYDVFIRWWWWWWSALIFGLRRFRIGFVIGVFALKFPPNFERTNNVPVKLLERLSVVKGFKNLYSTFACSGRPCSAGKRAANSATADAVAWLDSE